MATYTYETIPQGRDGEVRRYEIQQSMKDEPLSRHPETGEPIRRVITGGTGFISSGKSSPTPAMPAPAGGCHGGGCGCH